MIAWEGELRVVGKPAVRRSARQKVTGQAKYSTDISLPGMLYCLILRSKIPRGRVRSIGTTSAAEVPGVKLILTPWNFPEMPVEKTAEGNVVARRHPIAAEVRFVGDEIAAVVAETEDALHLLKVDYEELPAVIDPEDALKNGAPQITASAGNINGEKPDVYERGNLQKGEVEADWICEEQYTTEVQHHNPLEPHCCVALWQNDELTLWDSNQGPHAVKDHMVARLGISSSKIRIVNEFVGGWFWKQEPL